MRAYQLNLWKRVSDSYFAKRDDFCIGNQKRHKKALNLINDFIETYKNRSKNHIAIMHYIENSHDGNERANYLDNDLFNFLSENYKKKNFDQTAIILYSDHGSRFAEERWSPQGYLEERTPFFSIYLPKTYHEKFPNKIANLIKNSQQLTTPFDIYQTLRDIGCLDVDKKPESIRSISLLDEIPVNRSCEQIGISLHYCICELDWTAQDVNDKFSIQAANFVVNHINENLLKKATEYCLPLRLKTIYSIKASRVKNSVYLKVNLMTSPNDANYEAMINYRKVNEVFEFEIESSDQISRTNSYGAQPLCLDRAPPSKNFTVDLRKFCMCNQKIRKYKMPFKRRIF